MPVHMIFVFVLHAEDAMILIELDDVVFALANCKELIFDDSVVSRHHIFSLDG